MVPLGEIKLQRENKQKEIRIGLPRTCKGDGEEAPHKYGNEMKQWWQSLLSWRNKKDDAE